MKTSISRALWVLSFCSCFGACGDGENTGATNNAGGSGGVSGIDPLDFVKIQKSCAYNCPIGSCPEQTTPYACQNLGAWNAIPHDGACGKWSAKYPKPVAGKCTASEPSGDAAKYAGTDPDDPTRTILPDGRRITPAGKDWVFNEDITGGISTGVVRVGTTTLVAVVDTGPGDHVVRLVDTAAVGSGNPVTSYVKFDPSITLNSELAFVPPDLVMAPSGNGKVYALAVDVAKKTITQDDTRAITLPDTTQQQNQVDGWYASGVAVSPDGARLAVAPVVETQLLVYDVKAGSATFGQLLGKVDLGAKETFGVYFDPADTAGTRAYVTLWASAQAVEVNLDDPAAPKIGQRFTTSKDPESIAFLDTRWMVVSGDLGDSLNLVDRTAGTVTDLPVDSSDIHGLEPSALSYDAASKRLYAALSGINAVAAYDVDTSVTPPKITPAGRMPTAWWPSGLALLDAGALAVVSMRAHGTGPSLKHFDVGDGAITDLVRGGVQVVPKLDAAALGAATQAVTQNNSASELAGRPSIDCPSGASDFPVPDTNTTPSSIIKHVFFIVRENKNFDALLGDISGVNGDATLTLKTQSSQMDMIWKNFRQLARTFTIGDNYYTAAVQSTQGHVWTTYGRTNDFNERTWAISGGGHNTRAVPGGGVFDVGKPVEGSLFDWLGKNGVDYDIFGEIVGSPADVPARNPIDAKYPGGPVQNIGYNDLEKACYLAGRTRVLCNTGTLSYVTLPNDHTFGVSPSNPSPETFCAVNDEATGMVIDAISHSPLWESTLIVITEDDPLQGGEHVDSHRTPLVLVSPWVKRAYVSKTHIDTASLHKLFAHILGKPYRNVQVENALLPLDAFTSTPDYTPYTYAPRTWTLACGDNATGAEALLTESWDFREPDEQPGLGAQVVRYMRGEQLQKLTPEQDRRARQRIFALERELAEEAEERAAAPSQALRPLTSSDDDDD